MESKHTKLIFITGGVVSSLGKGIAAASLGALLKNRGLDVSILKLDPYLNVDPGTMNPFQHGEVFVTDDGAETDLDLGHYERYIDTSLTRKNSKTAGQIYQTVLDEERQGKYLGATVQVIPHVTNQIKAAIKNAADGHQILICEVGGTVGDIESLPFIEALRQIKAEQGPNNTAFIHVSYVPRLQKAGEVKTKPTQHSIKELLSLGIQPDILLLRSELSVSKEIKAKLNLLCNISQHAVINCPDVDTVYEVPLNLYNEGLDEKITSILNIFSNRPNLKKWQQIVHDFKNPLKTIKIAIVGKYIDLVESYKSIHEAIIHGAIYHKCKVEFSYIDAEELDESSVAAALAKVNGVLVPGGFGLRGCEGKILAVKYARENKIPFFGICLGMQIALIEFARNVAGIKDATSEEYNDKGKNKVIHLMKDQQNISKKGGTMRLGAYPCVISTNSLAYKIYGQREVQERHRHRYEVNNSFKENLKKYGLTFCGLSPDGSLVEMIELSKHPFFIGCQFHPEFLSRPLKPHPLFKSFINAALKNSESK